MVKRLTVMLLFLVLSGLVLAVRADVEFWSTDTFQLSQWGVNVIPEIRVRNNLSDFYYLQTYIGPVWELNKNLKLNVYYGLKYQKSGNDWQQSNLGYLDLNYTLKYLSHRSRLEGDLTNSVVKYRDQLQFKFNGYYLADEFFFNLTNSFLDENRLNAGYTLKVFGQTDLSLGYLLRSQRKGITKDWTGTAAVTLNAAVKI
jgi:hypothetical protein